MEEFYEKGFEELKILSEIIGRLENTINSRQNWLITIITGLVVALIKWDLSKWLFLLSSYFIILIFIILELSVRLPVSRAVKRSNRIQDDLLTRRIYNGPNYDLSGRKRDLCVELRGIISKFRFWGFFLGLILFILFCFHLYKKL